MKNIIFVSMEHWDEIWRRNQFICEGLSRHRPERKILFVEPPRDLSYAARTGGLLRLLRTQNGAGPQFPNIRVIRPWKLLPNSVKIGRKANQLLSRRAVRRAAREMGIRDAVLWLNPHWAGHLIGNVSESSVVYDITDDWTSLPHAAWLSRQIEEEDAEICERANATIVCSERLREMKIGLVRNLHLIPNGVDALHYARVLDSIEPLPAECMKWPKPVFGYTGTIHPARVDVGLVEAVARNLRNGSVVLIGPNCLLDAERQRLLKCGNVFMLDAKPYAEIPELMRGFDACIVPHLVTPFTESLNPIKLWEYLAAGKPIVSTPVAGFRDYPELVHLASGAEEFCRALEGALRESPGLAERRRQEARQHSWEKRVDAIEKVLLALDKRRRCEAL